MTVDHDALMMAHLIRALAPHGVGEDRIVITYEADLQDYDVLITGGELSEAQIEGLFDVARHGGVFRFVAPRNTERWDAQAHREGAKILKAAAAEARLKHPDLPHFDRATQTLTAFVRTLEVWAGFEPGSALTAFDDQKVTLALRDLNTDQARFRKLMEATSVLAEYDVDLLLIGLSIA